MSEKIGNWQLFEDENNDEMKIEKSRQSYEERMRYCKLCDELGLIYEDIEKITKWLRQPTQEQIKKYLEIDDKFFELFDTEEIKDLKIKRSEIKEELLVAEDKYWDDSLKESEISDKLYYEYGDVSYESKEKTALENDRRKFEKLKNQDKKILDEIQKKYDEIDKIINDFWNERWKELDGNEEIKILNEKRVKFINSRYKNDNTLTENEEIFNEFRKNYYNTEVERLFRRLGIDYLTRIPDEEIVNRGTIEDYISFIENNVLSMDKLYFDDYDKYYADTVLNKDI